MPTELVWPDIEADHPELVCDHCGGRNIPSWSVDSDRFNAAMAALGDDSGAIVCPSCFVLGHERATGMRVGWELRPRDDGGGGFRHLTEADETGVFMEEE